MIKKNAQGTKAELKLLQDAIKGTLESIDLTKEQKDKVIVCIKLGIQIGKELQWNNHDKLVSHERIEL